MPDKTFAVVIRCLNEERHLPNLLDAIRRQTRRPAEIIVVDSGSTDRTAEIAVSKGAKVMHIDSKEFSFGRALNFGARAAHADLLVIASAHTYPVSDTWFQSLLKPFDDSAVALVYGGQQGDPRSKFSELQIFRQWFPEQSSADQGHSFCNNANAAIRREIWATMPYDEQIPALEDISWAKRAIDRGFKIAYRADAAIVHVHEERYAKIYHRYRREGMGMRMIFPGEQMGVGQAIRLALVAIRTDIGEALREKRFKKVLWSVICFRVAQYWGTYRGLNSRAGLTSDLRARLYYPKGYRSPDSVEVGGSDPRLSTVATEKRVE